MFINLLYLYFSTKQSCEYINYNLQHVGGRVDRAELDGGNLSAARVEQGSAGEDVRFATSGRVHDCQRGQCWHGGGG